MSKLEKKIAKTKARLKRVFEKFYVGASRLSMRRMAWARILHTHVLHYNRRTVDP